MTRRGRALAPDSSLLDCVICHSEYGLRQKHPNDETYPNSEPTERVVLRDGRAHVRRAGQGRRLQAAFPSTLHEALRTPAAPASDRSRHPEVRKIPGGERGGPSPGHCRMSPVRQSLRPIRWPPVLWFVTLRLEDVAAAQASMASARLSGLVQAFGHSGRLRRKPPSPPRASTSWGIAIGKAADSGCDTQLRSAPKQTAGTPDPHFAAKRKAGFPPDR